MSSPRPPIRPLALALALGCGPTPGGDAGSEGGTGSSTSGSASQSSGLDSTTAVPDPTTEGTADASTTTATTTATDDTSTGEPPSVCDPQPMPDVLAWVVVDARGDVPVPPSTDPLSYTCTITDVQDGGGVATIELLCTDGPHTLDVGTSVGIWFDPAGELVLSVIYSQATFKGGDQLVTLRRSDGELVLAGANTPWSPDDERIPTDFFDPLEITTLSDACPIEPPADAGFVDPCYTVQRQALRFALEGEHVDVYDQGADQLSSYVLLVQYAQRFHDVQCTDTPGQWYAWVAVPPIPD